MKARLAVFVYRFGWWVSTHTFRWALWLDRDATAAALDAATGDQLDAVAEAFVELGEARRIAFRMPE
jgi:hypothetical protein